MKFSKYFILVKLLWLTFSGWSQTSPSCNSSYTDMGTYGVCDYAQWVWDLPVTHPDYCKMWYAKTNFNSTLTRLGSPFVNPVGQKLIEISDKQDYTKANGWELIRRNFGCISDVGYPYFVLYNRYTGMMRAYVYINNLGSQGYNGILMTMKSIGSMRTAITSGNRDLLLPADNYLNSPDDNDELAVYVGKPTGMSNWAVGEFMTTFDPNNLNSVFTNTTVEVSVYGIIENTIAAQITGTGYTEDYAFYGKSAQIKKEETNGLTKFSALSVKALKYVKDADELRKKINDASNKVAVSTFQKAVAGKVAYQKIYNAAMSTKILTDNKNSFASLLGNLSKSIAAVGAVTEVLKSVGTFLGFMTKNEAEAGPSVSPTITTYDLRLNGTITTQLIVQTINVKVPGTIHTNNNNLAYYDCILGTFNIKNKPVLESISYNRTVRIKTTKNYTYDYTINRHVETISNQYFKENYSSYRLTNAVVPTFNAGAGIELISYEVALVGEIGADGNSIYNPLQDSYQNYEKVQPPKTLNYYENYDTYINFMLADFEAGRLEFTKFDVDNGRHVFQTPFVNFNCSKGLEMNVRTGTKVYFRVKAIFKVAGAPDNQPPIFYQKDYSVDVISGTNPENLNYSAESFDVLPPYSNITSPVKSGRSEYNVTSGTFPVPFTPLYEYCHPRTGCLQNRPGYPLVNTPTQQSGVLLEATGGLVVGGGTVTVVAAQSWPTTYGGTKPPVTTEPVIFRAGNSIDLKPGFSAVVGSNFLASLDYGYHIPSCSTSLLVQSPPCTGYNNQAFRVGIDLEEPSEEFSNVTIYPNPNSGVFNISFNGSYESEGHIIVYNQIGKVVFEKTINSSENYIEELNLSDQNAGIYFVRATTSGITTVKPILISK